MAIFNGRYSWDGTKKDSERPIAWFPGTYNLKIIDCSGGNRSVEQLKPYICLFSETGEGQSIYANPEKFAQQICNDFSLNIERVLWVEEFSDDENRYDIIHFTRSGRLGNKYFYRAKRRPAMEKELHIIRKELATLLG
jgi:hypothetical protein